MALLVVRDMGCGDADVNVGFTPLTLVFFWPADLSVLVGSFVIGVDFLLPANALVAVAGVVDEC